MKKKNLLPLFLIPLTLTGCFNKGPEVIKDGKTINVKLYQGGYETEWFNALKEKFETLYASEGYKINVVSEDPTLEGPGALSEIKIDDDIDMFFVQSVYAKDIHNSYGTYVHDMNSIYNSKPVKYDGSEEETLIKDKIAKQEDIVKGSDGNYYGFMWANSPCGLIYNNNVLSTNDLEAPVTTDELFACYDVIKASGVRPFAWGGQNASGYALFALYPFLGQLFGKDGYKYFMSLQNDGVDDTEHGKEIYNDDRIYEAMDILRKMYNTSTSITSAVSGDNFNAHHQIMTDKAAFTVDGDFFYNEVKTDYSNKLNNIRFTSIPVASYLGVMLQLDGSGNNRERCDEILSQIIHLIDKGKSDADIVNTFTSPISLNQVERIREARVVYPEKACSLAYITKNTENYDLCEKLLRLAASDDYGHTFNQFVNSSYPYCSSNELSGNEFAKGIASVVNKEGAWGVNNMQIKGLRDKAAIPAFPTYSSNIVLTLVQNDKDLSKDEIKNKVVTNVNNNWNKWMTNAGY